MLAEPEDALAPPLGDELERVLARGLEADALDLAVEHEGIDEARAALVGAAGDRVREGLHPRRVGDRDDLVVLDVGADFHRQLGQPIAIRVEVHRAT
jgi:hypothetical protein